MDNGVDQITEKMAVGLQIVPSSSTHSTEQYNEENQVERENSIIKNVAINTELTEKTLSTKDTQDALKVNVIQAMKHMSKGTISTLTTKDTQNAALLDERQQKTGKHVSQGIIREVPTKGTQNKTVIYEREQHNHPQKKTKKGKHKKNKNRQPVRNTSDGDLGDAIYKTGSSKNRNSAGGSKDKDPRHTKKRGNRRRERCFGFFHCNRCDQPWTSAYTWRLEGTFTVSSVYLSC